MTVQRITWTEHERAYKSDVHRVAVQPRVINRGPDIGPAVFAKEVTEGIKLGPVSATYVAQVTCPATCAFKGAGCYAEHGPLAMVTTKRLNRRALALTALDVAHQEAEAIDRLTGSRDLRLHVVGDCATDETAQVVAAAAERFEGRGGKRVWTYTHAWRTVDRSAWGNVSVLASCERPEQVAEARSRGYAAALVVDEHRERKRYERDQVTLIPCPEQTTRGVQCVSCRLCFDDTRLIKDGLTIAFALHGDRAGLAKARRTLEETT
ncbi:MAG: hypothetical protein NUW01_00080 [Gemmatimonadaceae bacterium]|nr:hypothetical protein [Gemmatimonadaceae bacterium]